MEFRNSQLLNTGIIPSLDLRENSPMPDLNSAMKPNCLAIIQKIRMWFWYSFIMKRNKGLGRYVKPVPDYQTSVHPVFIARHLLCIALMLVDWRSARVNLLLYLGWSRTWNKQKSSTNMSFFLLNIPPMNWEADWQTSMLRPTEFGVKSYYARTITPFRGNKKNAAKPKEYIIAYINLVRSISSVTMQHFHKHFFQYS